MLKPVKFTPHQINFSAVGPEETRNGYVMIRSTPSAAEVTTKIIADDTDGLFTISSVEVFEEEREGGRPVGFDKVDESDGNSPIGVTSGQMVTVRVKFQAPNGAGVIPVPDSFSAVLLIEGSGWQRVHVPLSAALGQIIVIPDTGVHIIGQGEEGDILVHLHSIVGPPTDVSFGLSSLMQGITLAPSQVHIGSRTHVDHLLHFIVAPNAPVGSFLLPISFSAFGGRQSQQIKPEPVLDVRAGLSRDDSVQWELAVPTGILIDEAQDAWHAGCVRDVLPMAADNVLAASDTGGIWALNSGAGFCLTDWDRPDLICLAAGTRGPQHAYAGGKSLYETDASSGFPLWNWREIAGDGIGTVLRIAVLRKPARVVLACHNGIFWSSVPTGAHDAYQWRKAAFEIPFEGRDGAFYGLAATGEASVAVASWGKSDLPTVLFFGEWKGDELVLREARVEPGIVVRNLLRATSIASCETQPQHIYAVGSNNDGELVLMLRSHDAGRTWHIFEPMLEGSRHTPLRSVAGIQGNDDEHNFRANNCIAVHQSDPHLVVVGWQSRALFISFEPDRDDSWRMTESNEHFHEDIHGMRFDPFVGNENRLYVGGDGGVVAFTIDRSKLPLNTSANSLYNRRLANLQFASNPNREFYGTLSASAGIPGLVGGGLQDNGVVFALLESDSPEWTEHDGGDGHLVQFLPNGQVLRYNNEKTFGEQVRISKPNPFSGRIPRTPGEVIPVFSASGGLRKPVVEPVVFAREREPRTHMLILAVAGLGGDVYKLLVSDDGSDRLWVPVAHIPMKEHEHINGVEVREYINGVGSLTGGLIYVGTNLGRIFAVTASSGMFLELFVPLAHEPDNITGNVTRFVILSDSLVFALYNSDSAGYVLQQSAFSWPVLGSVPEVARGDGLPINDSSEGRFYCMDVDRRATRRTLFVASDARVFMSRDLGSTWRFIPRGLPRRPYCADMRTVAYNDGRRYLYLSTYGRSLWRARLDR